MRDVVAGDKQLLVALQLACERVRKEEMGPSAVTTIVRERVPGVKLLERFRDPAIGRAEHKVVVVAQQRILDQSELEPLDTSARRSMNLVRSSPLTKSSRVSLACEMRW